MGAKGIPCLAMGPCPALKPMLSDATYRGGMDDDAARTVQKILFSDGWSRLPADGATVLLMIVASEGPITRNGLHRSLLDGRTAEHGLNDAAWDEPHVYTDQELADLDEHFEGTRFETPRDEPRTAVEGNADEQTRRQADGARMLFRSMRPVLRG